MNYDFLSVSDGNGDAALMHITADRLTGATTIEVDDVTNVPAKFIATSGTLLPSGFIDISTALVFRGHLSGGDLEIDAFAPGSTDVGNTSGQVVVIKPNTWWADKIAAFVKNATGNGTPEDITVAALTAASAVLSSHATVGGDLKLSGATPTIEATGGASDIDINIKPKGKGLAKVDGLKIFGGYDYFASGCVWTGDAYGSTLLASMTAGVVVINGKPLTVAAINNRAFTASRDTYVDFRDNGDGTAVPVYNAVTNNAASQALTAGDIRNAIIVTGASNIAAAASINQGQLDRVLPIVSNVAYKLTDSLGNLICNRAQWPTLIGYRTQANGGTNAQTGVNGLATCPVIVPAGRSIKVFGRGTFGNFNTSQSSYSRAYVKDGASVTRATGEGWLNGSTAQSNTTTPEATDCYTPTPGAQTLSSAFDMAGYQMTVVGATTMVELV